MFFKPPLKEFVQRTSLASNTAVEENKKESVEGDINKKTVNAQSANDEIENLMDCISDEIKRIDIEKGTTKEPSPDYYVNGKYMRESNLSKSTLKGLGRAKSQMKILSSALKDSMMKKSNSPKILLRENTLLNYQV